jgi:hypothetical protein
VRLKGHAQRGLKGLKGHAQRRQLGPVGDQVRMGLKDGLKDTHCKAGLRAGLRAERTCTASSAWTRRGPAKSKRARSERNAVRAVRTSCEDMHSIVSLDPPGARRGHVGGREEGREDMHSIVSLDPSGTSRRAERTCTASSAWTRRGPGQSKKGKYKTTGSARVDRSHRCFREA